MNTRQKPRATCHPDRPHLAKGLCKKCYDAEYASANKEKYAQKGREWAKKNPDLIKDTRLRYRYGIGLAEFTAMSAAQDGLCKICNKAGGEHVDHDHETGQVRSLLCGDCNRAIGLMREDPEVLLRAIHYLDFWGKKAPEVIANTGRPVR